MYYLGGVIAPNHISNKYNPFIFMKPAHALRRIAPQLSQNKQQQMYTQRAAGFMTQSVHVPVCVTNHMHITADKVNLSCSDLCSMSWYQSSSMTM